MTPNALITNLERLAAKLRRGESCPVAPLGAIRQLCDRWPEALDFVTRLGYRVWSEAKFESWPPAISQDRRERNMDLIEQAELALELARTPVRWACDLWDYREDFDSLDLLVPDDRITPRDTWVPGPAARALAEKMRALQSAQVRVGRQMIRAPVRDIRLLVMEKALYCVLDPAKSAPGWAFQAAAAYVGCAEWYRGARLAPAAAPNLEAITRILRAVHNLDSDD